jgi:hypothetical protein
VANHEAAEGAVVRHHAGQILHGPEQASPPIGAFSSARQESPQWGKSRLVRLIRPVQSCKS